MLEIKGVQGSQVSVPEIEINVDTVYVRTNIQRISKVDEHTQQKVECWQYDEVQYSHREWIQVLSDKNKSLETSQALQDTNINATQEVVDFLMLQDVPVSATMSIGSKESPSAMADDRMLDTKNINTRGNSTMAMYIAIRVMKKGEISVEEGKKAYRRFLTHPAYAQFKQEVDVILLAEGQDNLIVTL